jgi:hypothetical protein
VTVYNMIPDGTRVAPGFIENEQGTRSYVVSVSFRVDGDIHVYHLDPMSAHDVISGMSSAAGTDIALTEPTRRERPSP